MLLLAFLLTLIIMPAPLSLPASGPAQTPTAKLHTLNETLQTLRTQLAEALATTPSSSSQAIALPLAPPLQAEGGSREIDRRAKEVVDAHHSMLHDLNETRDAVESLIEKYCLLTRRREDDVREQLGLEKGD